MIARNLERGPLGSDERLAQDLLKSGLPLRVAKLEKRVRDCERAAAAIVVSALVLVAVWGASRYLDGNPRPKPPEITEVPGLPGRTLNEKAGRLLR